MRLPPTPSDEEDRRRVLASLGILDTPAEPAFDDLTALAAHICDAPIALMSLVDGDRQWFKSRRGLEAAETPRDVSFCGHAIAGSGFFEVVDATADERFADNPLVTGPPHVRSYAAVPLVVGRHAVGTLCVIDGRPRRLSTDQRAALEALGRQAVRLLEMRTATARERGLRRDLFAQSDLSRSMIECAGEAIISADLDGRILSFNPAAERLLGYSAADVIGRMTPIDLHDPDEVRRAAEEVSRREGRTVAGFEALRIPVARESIVSQEWTYLRKDGGRVPVHLTISTLHDETGAPNGFLAVARDLTDRHRQLQVEKVAARIAEIVRSSQGDFIAGVPAAILFDRLLSAVLDFTGSEYGFIGEVLRDSTGAPYLKTHALTNIAWNDETRALYEANKASGLEFRNLRTLFGAALTTGRPIIANEPASDARRGGLPSGHPEMRQFLGVPCWYGTEMVGLIGLANRAEGYDQQLVTLLSPLLSSMAALIQAIRLEEDRKTATATSRDKENRLRRILETAAECFVEVGADGRVVEWNRLAAAALGVSRDAAVGRHVDDVLRLLTVDGQPTSLLEAVSAAGSADRPREVVVILPDGGSLPAELVAWQVPAPLGSGPVTCAFLRDIGDRKQLEEQQRLRFQSETLLKEVHHRIKNNMQVISSLLSIQSSKLDDERQRSVFLECRERIRAMSLIHDRLYSTGSYEQIDFADYLREMLALIVSSNRPAATDVEVSLSADPVRVPIERAVPLSLIASELVLNALKHGFHGRSSGALTVRLTRSAEDCELFVGDDGPGIPGRAEDNRGIGLRLIDSLVRQIRGQVEIHAGSAGVSVTWREP